MFNCKSSLLFKIIFMVLLVISLNIMFVDAQKTIIIKYGHNYPVDSPAHKAAEAFKSEVESKSNGTMKVDIYPAHQLGTNREQLEALQQGSVEIDLQPAATISTFVQEFQILDLPYVIESEELMWKVLDGDYGQNLLLKLQDKGIRALGYVWTGFKQITANRPIEKVEDLKGLKFRVMNSPLLIAQYKGYGCNAIPIDFSELYNALQQGVVDAQENGLWAVSIQRYYEVQTDLAITNGAPLIAVLMVGKRWYDQLTPEQQTIIDEAGRTAVMLDREGYSKLEKEALETIINNNVTIHEMGPEQIEGFRDASTPAYDFIRGELGDQILDDYLAAIEQNR